MFSVAATAIFSVELVVSLAEEQSVFGLELQSVRDDFGIVDVSHFVTSDVLFHPQAPGAPNPRTRAPGWQVPA